MGCHVTRHITYVFKVRFKGRVAIKTGNKRTDVVDADIALIIGKGPAAERIKDLHLALLVFGNGIDAGSIIVHDFRKGVQVRPS